jgi:hypothetical protein
MFDAPTSDIAGFADSNRIRELVQGYPGDEAKSLRYSGYTRSWELLQQHRDKLQSLAETLADRTELDRAEIASILG